MRDATDDFVRAARTVAVSPFDVIAGAAGGAGTVVLGTVVTSAATSALVVIPLSVVGVCVGVLMARGVKALQLERIRRQRAIENEIELDPARQFREEIAAAEASGAPPTVVARMWEQYSELLARRDEAGLLPRRSNVRGLLPGPGGTTQSW